MPLLQCLLVHKSTTAAPCQQVLGKACGNVNITDVSVVINTRDVPQVQFQRGGGFNMCVNPAFGFRYTVTIVLGITCIRGRMSQFRCCLREKWMCVGHGSGKLVPQRIFLVWFGFYGGKLVFPIEIHLQLIGIYSDDVMGVKHLTKREHEVRKLCNGPPWRWWWRRSAHHTKDGCQHSPGGRTDFGKPTVWVSPIPQRESGNCCFLMDANAKAHSFYRCKILKLGKRREACAIVV